MCVGFSIGCDTLEELKNYLKGMYSLRSGLERFFDPKGHMNFVRQKILTKVAITHELEYDEDVEEVASKLRHMRDDVEIDQPSKSPPRYESEAHKPEAKKDMQAWDEKEPHEDERIVTSLRFIEDDEFIKTPKFKDFWVKMKMKEFKERVKMNKMGADESQHDEIVTQTFKELKIFKIDITPDEAKRKVLKSDMSFIPSMKVIKILFLDQVINQDDPMLITEFDSK